MPQAKLKGVVDFDRPSFSELLECNLRDFFNFACIQSGGYDDHPVNTPGVPEPYGKSTLKRSLKGGFGDHQVWASDRSPWVHEKGFQDGVSPLVPAGVYVDGNFYATIDEGPYAHSIDFRRGMVVFKSPIGPNSLVQVPHATRRVTFMRADAPWFHRVFLDGWRYESLEAANDSLDILREYDVQTPVVFIDGDAYRQDRFYELGSGTPRKRPITLLHVFSSSSDESKLIADVIVEQAGRYIETYDLASRRTARDFELDASGGLRIGASTYLEALSIHPGRPIYVIASSATPQPSRKSLYITTCRLESELIWGDA